MTNKLRGTKKCPECGGASYVDMWTPGPGMDPAMRGFICSSCGTRFYVVIYDQDLLKFLNKQLRRD